MIRVAIYGGRCFTNRRAAYAILDAQHAVRRFCAVLHGDERGAHWLARDWARARGIPDEPFPANFKLHRRSAVPIRNARMIAEGRPTFAIEFPDPDQRDMRVRLALAGIPYCVIAAPPPARERPFVVLVEQWWRRPAFGG